MQAKRYVFLDQARGYAILGMILVNFLGMFDVMPWMLKHHHEGFSYADHIAPLFMFIVGMSFRISFQKMAEQEGLYPARKRAVRRYAILCILGLLYGGFHLPVAVWDALLDIGLSGLLALPFLHRSTGIRVAVACIFLAFYQALYSWTGYGDWVMGNSINGGPLGPFSWVFILLMGSAAQDWIRRGSRTSMIAGFFSAAVILSAAGWLLRAEWPGVKNLWHFSQYGMSAPYPIYATGLCFITLLLFYLACEGAGISVVALTTLGKNPLVLYLLQAVLVLIARITVSPTLSAPFALVLFMLLLGICYGVARYLEKTERIIKIG